MIEKKNIFLFNLIILLFLSSCLKKKLQDRLTELEKQGRLNELVDEYKTNILKNTSDAKLHFELATIYERMSELEKAMQEYKATILFDKSYESKVNPRITELTLKQARLDYQNNNIEKALANYKSVIALNPEKQEEINKEIISIYNKFAGDKINLGKFEEAMKDYSEVLKYDIKNQEALTGQIACLIGMKKYKEAEMEIEKLKTIGEISMDNALSDLKMKLGDMSFNTGDLEKARAYYDEAEKLNPALAENLTAKYQELKFAGLKKAIKEEKYDEALTELSEIKETNKDIKYEVMEAEIYEKKNVLDKAISKYEEILKTNPKNKNYYQKLIALYKADKNIQEEIRIKKDLIGAFGIKENPEVAEEIAKYDISKGNFKSGTELYSKLSEAYPKEARYVYENVILHTKLKDNKKAKELLARAEKLNPKLGEIYKNKYDLAFRFYIQQTFYMKLIGGIFGTIATIFIVMKILSHKREKLVYQGT